MTSLIPLEMSDSGDKNIASTSSFNSISKKNTSLMLDFNLKRWPMRKNTPVPKTCKNTHNLIPTYTLLPVPVVKTSIKRLVPIKRRSHINAGDFGLMNAGLK